MPLPGAIFIEVCFYAAAKNRMHRGPLTQSTPKRAQRELKEILS